MRQQPTEAAAIEAEIARLRSLALYVLRRRWRAVFGRTPPAALSKDLLGRMIARRLQEQAFGGLDRESLTFLDGLARRGGLPRRQLKPGTVLVREYDGRRHTVTVAADGFEWQGTTYASLSAIARAITGTAWSGPRFFAVRPNGVPMHSKNKISIRGSRTGSHGVKALNGGSVSFADSLAGVTQKHRIWSCVPTGKDISNLPWSPVLRGGAARAPEGQTVRRRARAQADVCRAAARDQAEDEKRAAPRTPTAAAPARKRVTVMAPRAAMSVMDP